MAEGQDETNVRIPTFPELRLRIKNKMCQRHPDRHATLVCVDLECINWNLVNYLPICVECSERFHSSHRKRLFREQVMLESNVIKKTMKKLGPGPKADSFFKEMQLAFKREEEAYLKELHEKAHQKQRDVDIIRNRIAWKIKETQDISYQITRAHHENLDNFAREKKLEQDIILLKKRIAEESGDQEEYHKLSVLQYDLQNFELPKFPSSALHDDAVKEIKRDMVKMVLCGLSLKNESEKRLYAKLKRSVTELSDLNHSLDLISKFSRSQKEHQASLLSLIDVPLEQVKALCQRSSPTVNERVTSNGHSGSVPSRSSSTQQNNTSSTPSLDLELDSDEDPPDLEAMKYVHNPCEELD